MRLACIGLSHKTAPVEVRERLAFAGDRLKGALSALRDRLQVDEVVILSTCNRVETYVSRADGSIHFRDLQNALGEVAEIAPDTVASCLYKYRDAEAVEHLFQVAASVDSMVVGETQILSQVKDAYHLAKQNGMTGKLFDSLFQTALSAAKDVHTLTGIGRRKVSVSSVAVELAERIFSGLAGRTVLVVGAGEMGELTLKSMIDRGADRILVLNRTQDKAEAVAVQVGGQALPWERLGEALAQADIVISSTGSEGTIVSVEQVREALRRRRYEPMFLIDIAVPRDIDPQANELDNVYLYDIDDLEQVVTENRAQRETELRQCRELIGERVGRFVREARIMDVAPVITNLTRNAHDIREKELARTLNKLGDLSQKEREEIEYLTNRVVNKLLNSPIEAIREEAASGDGYRLTDAAQRLFGLAEERDGDDPGQANGCGDDSG